MCLQCTGWVFGGYFIHFLVMYLQCTCWVHWPLRPVDEASVVIVIQKVWSSQVGSIDTAQQPEEMVLQVLEQRWVGGVGVKE